MLRFHSPFDGKRFIGDSKLKIFHDSLKEAPTIGANGCRIDEISAAEVRTFEPDAAFEAWSRGFVQCPYCRHAEERLHE